MKLYFAAAGRALRLLMRADPGLQTAHGLRLRVRPAGPARVVQQAPAQPRIVARQTPARPEIRHGGANPGGLRRPPLTRPHWGGVDLLTEDENLHFAVCGCTGSGKTLEIRLLMKSVLAGMRANEDRRALIYDAKRDSYPLLYALGLGPLVINMNPFDRRGVAWDLARDIQSGAEMDQFASIIIPSNPQDHNPFFTDAARILFRTAISALQCTRPGTWTLRDLVLTVTNLDRLKALLSLRPETKEIGESFFRAREISSVMTTIETKVGPLRTIAALWDRIERRISLRDEWLNRGSILLLAHHPSYSTTLEPINRAMFRFLSDAMLSLTKVEGRRSWVFLDEVREAGRLEGLRPLLTQGREKGVCVVLGFQDIEGMREVYGKEGASELIGECNSKTFLRTDNPATAEWMASHINKALIRSRQVATDREGKVTTTESLKIDGTVLAADFLGIPVTCHQFGRKGLHISSRIPKPYWTQMSLRGILAKLPAIPANVAGEDPRPKADQDLRPWTATDAVRLNLKVTTEPSPATADESETVTAEAPRGVENSPPAPPLQKAAVDAPQSSDSDPAATDRLWTASRRRKPNGEG